VEDLKLGPADWMKDVLKSNYSCARDPGSAWIPADLPACELKGTVPQGANEQQVASIGPEELKRRLDAYEPCYSSMSANLANCQANSAVWTRS